MSREPADIDIQELLAVALDETPQAGFADRVLEHLAVVKTAVELSRLIGIAPVGLVAGGETDIAHDSDMDSGSDVDSGSDNLRDDREQDDDS